MTIPKNKRTGCGGRETGGLALAVLESRQRESDQNTKEEAWSLESKASWWCRHSLKDLRNWTKKMISSKCRGSGHNEWF